MEYKLFDFTYSKMPTKEGHDCIVYLGDDKVFKIPSKKFGEMSLEEIPKFKEGYVDKRNSIPYSVPLTIEGIVKGQTDGKYYPVLSQQKLKIVGDESMSIWEFQKHKCILDKLMRKIGWLNIGGSAYYNKELKLYIEDIYPMNVGYDKNGNILIIDCNVFTY